MSTDKTEQALLALDLRAACMDVRRKAMPLADLIPLLQKAADALEAVALTSAPPAQPQSTSVAGPHWCTYCQGQNAEQCQFNHTAALVQTRISNTTALESLDEGDGGNCKVCRIPIRYGELCREHRVTVAADALAATPPALQELQSEVQP